MLRHVEILRSAARAIKPTPEDPEAPGSASEARKRLRDLLARLQADAPRAGLGAPTGWFVDHLAALAERYAAHLFVCFDHPRIPPTTNELERFFGASKAQLRRALGRGSTAGGVAQNLGGDYLVAFATTWFLSTAEISEAIGRASFVDVAEARAQVEATEAPARLRASRRRSPSRHLEAVFTAWTRQATPMTT